MSFAVLFAHHLSAPGIAVGFALSLVAMLVAAEERDLKRAGVGSGERADA